MNLITQVEAARVANVSRQAINDIKKKKTYNFFVGKKVDADSEAWKSYMHERSCNNASPVKHEKTGIEASKMDSHVEPVTEKSIKNELISDRESDRQKNRLTGGFDIDNYVPENIADVKRLAEIEKLRIEMEIRLGGLIDREMSSNIIDVVKQNIRGHFVDLPRRVSERICAQLEKVGMEKEVEIIMAPYVEKGIQAIKKEMKKALKIKING